MKGLLFFTFAAISSAITLESPSILNWRNVEQPKTVTTSYISRTCYEGFKSGHPDMIESGMYWIDPDGHGIGDAPIYVLCERVFTDSGDEVFYTTLIHDKEDKLSIPTCQADDCTNEIQFTYSVATPRQLEALTYLSEKCSQSVEISLIKNTLEKNIWWVDRSIPNDQPTPEENKHYFWASDADLDENNEKIHICSCGLDQSCIDTTRPCNCDLGVAIPLTDSGIITNKNLLPITKVHFGKIEYDQGSFKLGRLQCTGKQPVEMSDYGRVPQSCKDFWLLGHSVSGVFTIPSKPLTNIGCPVPDGVPITIMYCDFTQPDDDKQVLGYLCANNPLPTA